MQSLEAVLTPVKVPDSVKADAWDAFQQSKDENELAQKLMSLELPKETKAVLWDLKRGAASTAPSPAMLAAVQAAQGRLRQQVMPKDLQGGPMIPQMSDTVLGSQLVGADPGTLLDRMGGGAASVINTLLPGGDVNKRYPIPQLTPNQQVGARAVALGTAAQGGQTFGQAVVDLLPNAKRAGLKFEQVMAAAKKVPIDTSKADAVAGN